MPKKKAVPVNDPEQVVAPGQTEQPEEEKKATVTRGKMTKAPPTPTDEITSAFNPFAAPAEDVTPSETVPASDGDLESEKDAADVADPSGCPRGSCIPSC